MNTTEKTPTKFNKGISRILLNAVRKLQGKKGVSLVDIKNFLKTARKVDMKLQGPEINMILKNGLQRGILTKIDGNYKVREAKRRKSRSKSVRTKPQFVTSYL